MKNTATLFLMLFASHFCIAQNPDIKRTMHWYFGYGAGLDFKSGQPVADTTGKSNGEEQCFTMSDTCGDLLFYGAMDDAGNLIIWNKNHEIMENGVLNSCCTPTQSVCIPQPNNDSIYYIFYNHLGGSLQGKFNYAILNINQNEGFGKLISWDNSLIDSMATEKVAAINHCNDKDVWISSKQREWPIGRLIYSWLLTENGISNTPVVSDIASIWEENGDGYFRFSPDGSKAAVAYIYQSSLYYKDSSYIELYEFDNCTGIFSNPITLPFPQPYGLCFSPDNSKLYVMNDDAILFIEGMENNFVQYDISNYNQAAILSSKTILRNGAYSGSFQLGLDGKIYVTAMDTLLPDYGLYTIGVINNPNAAGLACNLDFEAIDLQGRIDMMGLPYYNESYFSDFNFYNCFNSIDEKTAINLKIFPNPFVDVLILESTDDRQYTFTIDDLIGKQAYKNTFFNTATFNLSQLQQGIYFLKIYYKNQLISNNIKIIKL